MSRADGCGLQGSQRQLRLSWGPLPTTLTYQGPLSCQPPPSTYQGLPGPVVLVVKHEAAAVKEIGEELAQVVVAEGQGMQVGIQLIGAVGII